MASAIKQWTLEELHSLPDDGNKYELVDGELFVTPPPTDEHETIAARLSRILDPFVAKHRLGFVYRPRAVIRTKGKSEVEPDLMVRQPQNDRRAKWDDAPIPMLVVEILSPFTRLRDRTKKRDHYMNVGVPEYWIVDPEEKNIIVVRAGRPDGTFSRRMTWSPAGLEESLVFDAVAVFG